MVNANNYRSNIMIQNITCNRQVRYTLEQLTKITLIRDDTIWCKLDVNWNKYNDIYQNILIVIVNKVIDNNRSTLQHTT